MKQKYRHTFRCPECRTTFKKISTVPDLQCAACPECKKQETRRAHAIGDGAVSDADLIETPAFIHSDRYSCNSCSKMLTFRVEQEGDMLSHCYRCGSQDVKRMGTITYGTPKGSESMIKALDVVAEGSMKSYGMTDLNLHSSMRPGDSCAPKLPPAQQKMADNFFNQGKNPMLKGVDASAIGRRAMAGAYRDPNNPVAMAHRNKLRPGTEGKFVDATLGRK